MRKKIHHRFVGIAVLSILSMTILLTVIFYNLLCRQMFENLRTIAELLIENHADSTALSGTRVTVIAPDGTVLSDNEANASQMENHKERPEVKDALLAGNGKDVRRSDTLERNCYYYAQKRADGSILRVSRESVSVFSMLKSVLPAVCGVIAVLLNLCMFFSRAFTAALLRPIDEMARDMDHMDEKKVYDEFRPFVKTIKEQHDEILKAAHMRQDFTANVSHELKTPLTSISGYAELIETGMATEDDTRRFAGEIRRSAQRLLSLINDIIRLSQLDVIEDNVKFEELNLSKIAETSVDMLKINAEKHQVSLSYQGNRNAMINGNKEMVEEVLYNLIDNAIRYNQPGGSVTVSVEKLVSNVVLMVADTGIGIPKEHQERIFERFYRVDKSRSKSLGGTGLGLAIVKHIILRHNAALELNSKEGIGTTIRIIFSQES